MNFRQPQYRTLCIQFEYGKIVVLLSFSFLKVYDNAVAVISSYLICEGGVTKARSLVTTSWVGPDFPY